MRRPFHDRGRPIARPVARSATVGATAATGTVTTAAARGFTLIEVLVAMAIIAVGVSALVASAASSAWRQDYLREREFGRWVASNELATRQALPAWPDAGTSDAEVEMAGIRWYVRTRTRAVADPDLRRLDIEVRTDRDVDSYIYSVTGFVGNPETRQGPGGGQQGAQLDAAAGLAQ